MFAGIGVGRRRVQTHAHAGRFLAVPALGQEGPDDAAEHITHAAAGHPGVAVVAHGRRFAGISQHQRAGPFQHQGSAVALP